VRDRSPLEKAPVSTPLLLTKLNIHPPRPRLVSRPHLIARLNAGLQGKLSLVSAPAGYGKTTLVTEWVRSLEIKTAWLFLGETDNEPTRQADQHVRMYIRPQTWYITSRDRGM
jgi:ATP/maltotriose-dependent transcriptional regulator MalT